MKRSAAIIGIVAIFSTAYATSQSAGSVEDDKMGLSKTSVFDDPSPDVFDYPQTKPSEATALPRAWDSAPPQIPHKTDTYVPITADKNKCLSCHDEPDTMGKKEKGSATAMSESHYTRVDGNWQSANARYVCVQCHTPQAEVKELVGNTFAQ